VEDEEAGGGEGGDADAGGVSWGWWGGVGLGISESRTVKNKFWAKRFLEGWWRCERKSGDALAMDWDNRFVFYLCLSSIKFAAYKTQSEVMYNVSTEPS